jgi:hypothetical protein
MSWSNAIDILAGISCGYGIWPGYTLVRVALIIIGLHPDLLVERWHT